MNRSEPREITESFRLERVLKSSRSAIVFRAASPETGAAVVIKLIPPPAAGVEPCRERFLTTMGVLESAPTAGFPRLLDYGFSPDGSAFMVMELVEGVRLDTLKDPSPDRILRLVLGTLDGVELLARGGVSHGNLAPENLLASGPGDAEHPVILGCGTAAFHGGVVGTGGIALADGSAQFAAPEQLDPVTAAAADWRADLYALAASTCALLRGEIVAADSPAPSVSLPISVRTQLVDPVALQVILEQGLRREPGERPASLAEFRQAVSVALAGPPAEPEPVPAVEAPAPAVHPETEARPEAGPGSAPAAFTPYQTMRLEAASLPVAAPEPAAPSPGEPTPPPVEKVKTGPVPIQRLGELPTAALPVQPQAEQEEAAGPAGRPEPAFADQPLPEAAREAGAEPAVAGRPVEAPSPEAAPAAPAVKTATAKAAQGRKRSILPWAAALVGVVALGSVAAWYWIQQMQPARPPAPRAAVEAPRRPSPSPQPVQPSVAVAQLDKAEAAIALGDLATAGAALDAISQDDLAGLSQEQQERRANLRSQYMTMHRQALTRGMQKALGAGKLKELADAVRDVSSDDETAFKRDADFSASLDESRRVLNLQATMLKAQRQGDQAQALESASVLVGLVPRYAPAAEARERAAAMLEHEADALEGKGSFDLALARLDAVRRAWPARPGLQARIDRVKTNQEADQKFTAAMTQAQKAGAENAPEKGLALLASLPPSPRTAERVQQLHDRLAKQLEQLDAQPPTLALTPGLRLEYKKGEAVTLTFKLQDDHGVKSAQLFARVEGGGKFVELPFRHVAGDDWSAEVTFAFHQNQTVEFYAVAADHSGHLAQLGSAQQPLKLKRKKNLFGF